MVDLRTPSSPHSTLWSTTFASPDHREGDLLPTHPSPKARSSPSPSSRVGAASNFYRYATGHLTDAFPTLPERSQFDRLLRSCTELIEAFSLHLASLLTDARKCPYQALDSSAMPIRDCKRRGHGWLAGDAYTSVGPTASAGTYRL